MEWDATLILRREYRHTGGGGIARRTDGALRRQYLLNRPHPNPSPVSGDGTWGIVARMKIGKLNASGRKAPLLRYTPDIENRRRWSELAGNFCPKNRSPNLKNMNPRCPQ